MNSYERQFIKAYKEICKCNVEIVQIVSYGEYKYIIKFFHYRFLKWFKEDYTGNIEILVERSRSVGGGTECEENIKKLRFQFNSESDATKVVNTVMKLIHSLAAPYIGKENGLTVDSRSVKDVIFIQSL